MRSSGQSTWQLVPGSVRCHSQVPVDPVTLPSTQLPTEHVSSAVRSARQAPPPNWPPLICEHPFATEQFIEAIHSSQQVSGSNVNQRVIISGTQSELLPHAVQYCSTRRSRSS